MLFSGTFSSIDLVNLGSGTPFPTLRGAVPDEPFPQVET